MSSPTSASADVTSSSVRRRFRRAGGRGQGRALPLAERPEVTAPPGGDGADGGGARAAAARAPSQLAAGVPVWLDDVTDDVSSRAGAAVAAAAAGTAAGAAPAAAPARQAQRAGPALLAGTGAGVPGHRSGPRVPRCGCLRGRRSFHRRHRPGGAGLAAGGAAGAGRGASGLGPAAPHPGIPGELLGHGAGVDLISACDIRFCSQDAYFQVKEVDMGLAADVGTLQRLPKIVGSQSLVNELAFTARIMRAPEALSCGLVSRVLPDKAALLEVALEVAEAIAARSPVAVQGTKVNLLYSRDRPVSEGLQHVATWNMAMLQTEDIPKSVQAALDKKGPEDVPFAKL
nr:delta(3,5)-Delta(2,4)-dienoyl-CoA isomerase, mitochondrial isoform X1 [Taeniopygia guttata]